MPINVGSIITVAIEHEGEIVAIGTAIAKDIPALVGLFKTTKKPDGTDMTPGEIAALVADTQATDNAIETRADAEIADAARQLADGDPKPPNV